MIQKEYGRFKVVCSNCEEVLAEDFDTWQDAKDWIDENSDTCDDCY